MIFSGQSFSSASLWVSLIGQAGQRTFIEVGRVQSMNQWWHWLALLLVCLFVLAFVVVMYRRDSVELTVPMRMLLTLLRLTAFVGLLVFFLQIERRTEQRITKNSRVAVLVDASQSMALRDATTTQPNEIARTENSSIGSEQDAIPSDSATGTAGGQGTARRIDAVIRSLVQGDWIERLREQHDVGVYRFGQHEQSIEVVALAKDIVAETGTSPAETYRDALGESRRLTFLASLFLLLAVAGAIVHLFRLRTNGMRSNGSTYQGWGLLVAVVALIVAFVTFGVCNIRNPRIGWAQLLGAPVANIREAANTSEVSAIDSAVESSDGLTGQVDATVNWAEELQPRDIKTRLGDALRYVIEKERGGSLAGVVTITDGNVNAGSDPLEVAQAARAAGIPFFNIGMGSDQQPANVRVADIEAPSRVFPGDAFKLIAYIQSFGLSNEQVKIELFTRDANQSAGDSSSLNPDVFVEERRAVLPADGESLPVEFELTPDTVGSRTYVVRVSGLENDIDPLDNQQSVRVRIVDRQNRMLIIAGGPMRDYRFLRTQAFRDKEIVLDVLLQSSPKGAAQEADRILEKFPETPDEMFEYDCIVAFDPDWEQLSTAQLELLEDWVATQAGGLILVAGPVHTPEWSSMRRGSSGLDAIRALYPVVFYSRSGITLGRGAYEAEEPTPISFSTAGLGARFLWLDETAEQSEAEWAQFDGVYGYQPTKDVKPGATVYARFGNPEAAIDGKLPVYMAGQFYGAGRVFYLGSGEMWRLRAHDTRHFEQFYTRLIRYVSEGRLLRDSSRGLLLLDKDRCSLGETVTIRASLTDSQHRPLADEQVEASIVLPDGSRKSVTLRRLMEGSGDGVFANQFVPTAEGNYRIELIIPDNERLEVLNRELRVRVPDIEVEHPQRNDALLSDLARSTAGRYFVGLDAAIGTADVPTLSTVIAPQDQETYLPGTPDLDFERRLMSWLLGLICGALCLEWLFRRLYKLA